MQASSLALSAKASLASRRALEVSRATKKTYELGLAETLQSILSKQRHAEVKKMEMVCPEGEPGMRLEGQGC